VCGIQEVQRATFTGNLTFIMAGQCSSVLAGLDTELALQVRTCEGLRSSAQGNATELRGTSEQSIGLLVGTKNSGVSDRLLCRLKFVARDPLKFQKAPLEVDAVHNILKSTSENVGENNV
jgi:hypothetical protein